MGRKDGARDIATPSRFPSVRRGRCAKRLLLRASQDEIAGKRLFAETNQDKCPQKALDRQPMRDTLRLRRAAYWVSRVKGAIMSYLRFPLLGLAILLAALLES